MKELYNVKNKIGNEINQIYNCYNKVFKEISVTHQKKHEKLINEENKLKERRQNKVTKTKEQLGFIP